MDTAPIKINTDLIPSWRAKRIGKAFYYAFLEFMQDPENAAMIEREAEELRQQWAAEKNKNTSTEEDPKNVH